MTPTFKKRLDACTTFEAIRVLVEQAPATGPARQPYANLSFFALQGSWIIPHGASREELVCYLGLVQRLAASGSLDASTAKQLEASLRAAIPKRL